MGAYKFCVLPDGIEDLSGRRFGRLLVLGPVFCREYGGLVQVRWACKCDCGNHLQVATKELSRRKSCGCAPRRGLPTRLIHGAASRKGHPRRPEYVVWSSIQVRCHNRSARDYRRFGARGIRVCDAWRESYLAFIKDMGERPSDEHCLARRDRDKGYDRDNCYWGLKDEERRRPRTQMIEIDGVTKSTVEWAKISGIPMTTIWSRVRRGWRGPRVIAPVDTRYHRATLPHQSSDKP